MMLRHNLRALSALALSAAVFACGDDRPPSGENQPPPLRTIDKTSALEQANANLRNILTGTARSAVILDDAQIFEDIADAAGQQCSAVPVDPNDPTPPPPADCYDFQLEDDANSAADRVARQILNIANVETEEATRIVLRLIPERICTDSDAPDAVPDPECVQAFTEVPIRIELTSRVEGDVDIGLLVGESRVNPIDLQLYRSEIAIEIDLGAGKEALGNLLTAMGGNGDELPEVLTGRVRFSLEKNAENDFTFAFSILSAIQVEVVDVFSFRAGTANPAISVRFDGNQQQVTATTGFGELRGEVPLAALFPSDPGPCTFDPMTGETVCEPAPPDPEGTLGWALGALKWSSVLRADAESVRVENIDLGSGFEMTINNQPLVGFDANVDTIEVASGANGVELNVSPSLSANLSLDFRNVADRLTEPLPSFMLDEDLSVELNGAASPGIRVNDMTQAIQVSAGTLTIRSRAAGRTVTVGAGMCLIESEPDPGTEPEHPIELLSAGMCPAS